MCMLSTSAPDLALAARALAEGRLVAFPTETVYGLGGDAFNPRALARIFAAKNRPRFDPLIVHIADLSALGQVAAVQKLSPAARGRLDRVAGALWPGPLTLILPKAPDLPPLATADLPTVAVRLPDHPVARELIRRSGRPVAAPSANPFGRLSPTRAEHVRDQLGDQVDFIIDGGKTTVGVESTVLDLTSPGPARILRPGGCSRERVEALIGPVEAGVTPGPPQAPGQLPSHYAPHTPLVLYPRGTLGETNAREGRLLFQGPRGEQDDPRRALSSAGDLAEAAANLFDTLHELDRLGLARILAEEAPPEGLGAAINDRLRRAAARPAP